MSVELHDFRTPPPLTRNHHAQWLAWMQNSAASLDAFVHEHVSADIPLRVSVETVEASCWDALLPTLRSVSIGFRVSVASEGSDTLMILGRPFARLLVDALLGGSPSQLPDDGELSLASNQVLRFFLDELLRALRDNWRGGHSEYLPLQGEECRLNQQQILKPNDAIVVVRFQFTGQFGAEPWLWVVPRPVAWKLMHSFDCQPSVVQTLSESQQLEGLIGEMPARVTVRLGTIELTAQELRGLQPGDVLVLDQKVDLPLSVTVAEECAFLGWPGKIGTRQAVQIDSLVKG